MSIIECPHCLNRIMPNSSGIFPSCRKNTQETEGLDLSRTLMKVSTNQRLPNICYHCTAPATLTYRVTRSRTEAPAEASEKRAIATILSILFLSPLWSWFINRGGHELLIIELPICENCTKSLKPEVHSFDFTEDWMAVAAHKEFKIAANELQRRIR